MRPASEKIEATTEAVKDSYNQLAQTELDIATKGWLQNNFTFLVANLSRPAVLFVS